MRLITARPHRLLGEVIRRMGELMKEGGSCMLIVPSQYTLQAEIEVMTRLNLPGTFLIDVLSPGRLKTRVFDRAGQPGEIVLDERGKCMVLAEVVEQERENLTIYRASAVSGAQGLVAKLSSLIADMKRSGMNAEELHKRIAQMDERDPAKKKLADAARIFEGYERRMAGRLADGEDVALIMREKMAASGVVRGRHVFIYGFDMITETFARDMLAISKNSDSLTLAVETDENGAPDGRLFAPVNLSLERLARIAKEMGEPLERERVDAELGAPQDIAAMERGLFALGGKAEENAPEHIELYAASGPRAEVHRAAARIRELAQAGEDMSQMAIVYLKGSGYAPLIHQVLPMYGIAAYVAERRAANAHPLSRFVLYSLRAVSGGFATGDVVECIRSGFLPVTQEAADALIAYAQGVDVRMDGWKRPFTYHKEDNEAELTALNKSREAVIAPLTAMQGRLRRAKSADDTIAAVLALLEETEAFERLADMRMELMDAGMEPEAQDCAQVWNALMETLDQLHTLLGGSAVPAKTVTQLLASGLSALELSALPPADGAVICGEIGNVRTAQVHTLFALGMNDLGGGGEDGLLTPGEREAAVRATGAYLGMSAGERAALSQLDILKALTGCTGRLIVSYALADETGRALREGAAVTGLRRLFPKMTVHGGLPQEEMLLQLSAPDAALEALSVHLSRVTDGKEELGEAYAQAFAAMDMDDAQHGKLVAVTRKLSEAPERKLDAGRARSLYGRPVMSVSRLEMAARCPYQHFVRYGLSPQRELEPGVDRAELGTLYHEAAEKFTREVTALPQFPNVPEQVCDEIMDRAVAPLIGKWRASPLGESERGGAIAARIRRTARRAGKNIVSQYAGGSFAPMSFELAFGQGGVAPITLQLGDGTCVYLQGRIDRIDVLDADTKRIRVIDYKSGVKKFDPTMAYWGIQLQLLIYLAAALERIPGAAPAGFFYCRIADPMVKTESRIREEVEKQIAKKLSLAGVSLSDITILRAQDEFHQQMVTKDGKPSGRYAASMVDEAGMQALVSFAKGKAVQLAREAYGGAIDDAPATLGQYNACTLCDYAAVCGFDPARKQRRRLTKKKLEDMTGKES